MRNFLPIVLTALILAPSTLFSQQTAVTKDGQTVVLKPDGTWRFESLEHEDVNAQVDDPSTLVALARKALERNEAEGALSYAERALALAEQTYGKAFFYYGVSAWSSGEIDLALSAFEDCSRLTRSRYARVCQSELKRLEHAGINGAYDTPPWATDPTYLDERIQP